nr:bifunctional diaminohydroxyphosphoribosylaminopyrimidine deaminase/5-amino-6-(5-phosphoribosylamino)uracil reductase RibD [uncultured Holophaga sp.]
MDSSVPELSPAWAWQLATGGPWPDPNALRGDERLMSLAIQEGLKGVGLSSPNPPVGCVIARDGRVIGRGVHVQAGTPHGEIMALRDAASRGNEVKGATAYVTLEPCCHYGRTPPCTEALLAAGIARVVVGTRDPNPRVDGGGMALLRSRGIEVTEAVLGEACSHFHAPFFKLIRTGLPWVVLKLAVGSDGSTGPDGERTEITSPEIQGLAHALRRACEAIVVGSGTVAVDDPSLTDRWPEATLPHRRFLRVVLDTHGHLAAACRVWQPVEGQPALRATVGSRSPIPGVEDLQLPPGPRGCSLRHLLHELAARGVGRVLLEGGPTLAKRAMVEGLVDEFHRFRSERPAGGPPVLGREADHFIRVTSTPFPGGSWDVLLPGVC